MTTYQLSVGAALALLSVHIFRIELKDPGPSLERALQLNPNFRGAAEARTALNAIAN